MSPDRPRRILIYRSGALGDAVVALPAIHSLRDHFRDAEFALITASSREEPHRLSADVLQEYAGLDRQFRYAARTLNSPVGLWRLLCDLRDYRPDLVVHLGTDKNSRLRIWRDLLFLRLSGATRLVACYSDKITWFGRLRRAPRVYEPEVDRLLGAVRSLGIEADPSEFRLPIRQGDADAVSAFLGAAALEAGRPLVALCPGSKQPAKRWPVERYAELGQRLIEEGGVNVAIVGGDGEREVGDRIGEAWPAGRWTNAAARLSIPESAELLRGCAMYVGNDTGAMHLAAAVATRCVAVFSARDARGSWDPYGDGHVVLRRDVTCQNCYLTVCTTEGLRCLTGIDVGDVWSACRGVLAEVRAG